MVLNVGKNTFLRSANFLKLSGSSFHFFSILKICFIILSTKLFFDLIFQTIDMNMYITMYENAHSDVIIAFKVTGLGRTINM